MRFHRHIFLASLFLLVPAVALLVVGVLVLVFQRAVVDITFGVLIVAFCTALLVGTIVLVISLKRDANLAQLQLDFLSKVSHELKTPLTSIRMFVETLSEQQPRLSNEQRERCLAMLRAESARLSGQIDRLLDFGRMEAGRMQYHPQAETLPALIEWVVRAFEPVRLREGAELRIDVPAEMPPLMIDREMIGQALLNLLSNACKYGGERRRIHLSCRDAGTQVAISVRDEGPGIPRKERRRIFERFYRIDDRLSRRQEGSGLGLAIVRHIVQAHGGRVTVRNHPEGGAEFTLRLPVAPRAAPETASAVVAPRAS